MSASTSTALTDTPAQAPLATEKNDASSRIDTIIEDTEHHHHDVHQPVHSSTSSGESSNETSEGCSSNHSDTPSDFTTTNDGLKEGNHADFHTHLYDPLHKHIHRVEYAAANHHEVLNQQLSTIERFYVDVANVYTYQQQHRKIRQADSSASSYDDRKSNRIMTAHERRAEKQHYQDTILPQQHLFREIEQKLHMSRFQIDNIVQTIEHINKRHTLRVIHTDPSYMDGMGRAVGATHRDTQTQQSIENDEKSIKQRQRNRLITLMQYKENQYKNAATVLRSKIKSMRNAKNILHNYIHDLQQLSVFWRIRQPHITTHYTTTSNSGINPSSSLIVSYKLGRMGLQPIVGETHTERGYTHIHRDDDGHIFLDMGVGSDIYDSELFYNKLLTADTTTASTTTTGGATTLTSIDSNNIELQPLNLRNNQMTNDTSGISSKADETNAVADQSNDTGFPICHQQLHKAQIGLIYREIYTLMMKQAIDISSQQQQQPQSTATTSHSQHIPLKSQQWHVTVLQHKIGIHVPEYPILVISFKHAHRGIFHVEQLNIEHRAYMESLQLNTIQEVLDYHKKLSSISGEVGENRKIYEPPILSNLVTSIHHFTLVNQLLKLLVSCTKEKKGYRFVTDDVTRMMHHHSSNSSHHEHNSTHRCQCFAFQLYGPDGMWIADVVLSGNVITMIYVDGHEKVNSNHHPMRSALPHRIQTESYTAIEKIIQRLTSG